MTISLRTRLLAGIIIATAVLLSVFSVIVYTVTRQSMIQNFDASLLSSARMLSALVMAGLFVVGWYGGIVELTRAFDQCVERGEEVREALEGVRTSSGEYPQSLARLADVSIPGRRLLRPDLMEYDRVDGGYRLTFSDAVTTMSATHERGFFDRE